MTTRQPWERIKGIGGQRGESSKAFAAFCIYRDMPPATRSIAKAVEQHYGQNYIKSSSKIRQWGQWSAQWNWVARATAWDEELDRISRQEQIEAIQEMNRRHITMAQMLQKVALATLKDLQRYVEAAAQAKANDPNAPPITAIRPHTLLNLFIQAAKMERIARGKPAQVTEVQMGTTTNVGRDVTPDEYDRLVVAAIKALAEQGLFSAADLEGLE